MFKSLFEKMSRARCLGFGVPPLAVTMQLKMGSTCAPACSDRRPRRSACAWRQSLYGGPVVAPRWSARAPTTAREARALPEMNCMVTAEGAPCAVCLGKMGRPDVEKKPVISTLPSQNRAMNSRLQILLLALIVTSISRATDLGIDSTQFTINGKRTFL